ncbi:PAC2 family protein [Corynebacterium sphenisci]|uniref:PAC2 family protein n=1 Tax=Corynebacterium sphenisci TaxID=191493 RepID=UPI00095171E3|nr:PAC2 family protein [Corynebacterium sphenisci]
MAEEAREHRMYDMEFPAPEVRPAEGRLTMVVALQGYADAGMAVGGSAEHLVGALEHRAVVSFHNDELIDYRSRRPAVTMAGDEIAAMKELSLTLQVLRDDSGKPFLLLSGPEPDFRWDGFSEAVADLAERFDVGRTVSLYAAPMTVPHTRPLGLICHGNDPEVLARNRTWGQRVTVPGAASLRLELELSRRGRSSCGFTAQVPHYIAQSEYPEAILALLRAVADTGGLDLPLAALEREAGRVRGMLDEQVRDSAEVARIVELLEQQYDEEARRRELLESSPLVRPDGSTPTADELGAEFERFLADRLDEDAAGAGEDPLPPGIPAAGVIDDLVRRVTERDGRGGDEGADPAPAEDGDPDDRPAEPGPAAGGDPAEGSPGPGDGDGDGDRGGRDGSGGPGRRGWRGWFGRP